MLRISFILASLLFINGCENHEQDLLGKWHCDLANRKIKGADVEINQEIEYRPDHKFISKFEFKFNPENLPAFRLKVSGEGNWRVQQNLILDVYENAKAEFKGLDQTSARGEIRKLLDNVELEAKKSRNKSEIIKITDNALTFSQPGSAHEMTCFRI